MKEAQKDSVNTLRCDIFLFRFTDNYLIGHSVIPLTPNLPPHLLQWPIYFVMLNVTAWTDYQTAKTKSPSCWDSVKKYGGIPSAPVFHPLNHVAVRRGSPTSQAQVYGSYSIDVPQGGVQFLQRRLWSSHWRPSLATQTNRPKPIESPLPSSTSRRISNGFRS